MSLTRGLTTAVACLAFGSLLALGGTARAAQDPCATGLSQTPSGEESSVDCRDGKKSAPVAQVAASVDQLPFVAAEKVLFAQTGCTALDPAAAPSDSDFWRCPIRRAPDPAPAAPTGPAAIAREAGLRLIARPGTVGVLPERTLVGLPTYYCLDGIGRRQAQHTQDGWHLRILAQPVTYTWQFGDGVQLGGGPGQARPPQSSQIQHTYRKLGRYDVAVQVTWHVTFQVNGRTLDAPGAFTTTTSTELPVDELRTLLTH